ncbi:MAG: hypothetical protein GC184_03455 [Rhizobiales bacterium]|nr:hypothetical protein [Hyphomicrobiales bacterium]
MPLRFLIEIFTALAAFWGAGLSTYLAWKNWQLTRPEVRLEISNADPNRLKLFVTNRSSESIIVESVRAAKDNICDVRAIYPENDTTLRTIRRVVGGDDRFHLRCDPGEQVSIEILVEQENFFSLSVNVGWYFETRRLREHRTVRARWSIDDISMRRRAIQE